MVEQIREQFQAEEYWEGRLGKTWGLESVGDQNLSLAFNQWMYRVRRHCVLRQIADVGLDVAASDVLDIGSGTGFYVDLWHELGARSVTGSDLTNVAVANLRASRPQVPFRRLDIGAELPADLPPDSFDAISAYDMFFHIVDDARFEQALRNIATLLRPGGMLLFSDTLLTAERPAGQPPHVRWRQLEAVHGMLNRRGFTIVDQRPMFVLMNAPVDSSSRARRLVWSLIAAAASRGERVGGWIGRGLIPVELRLLARGGLGPGVRMFACRRGR